MRTIHRLLAFALLATPLTGLAQETQEATHRGFTGIGAGYFTGDLEVSGFSAADEPDTIRHTHAGPGIVLQMGHRMRHLRTYGELVLGAAESETKKTQGTVLTDIGMVSLVVDGMLPVGRGASVFAGVAFGELNYETNIRDTGDDTDVVDHTDLVNWFHAGYLHDFGRLSVEASVRYVINDEKQDSGRWQLESSSMSGFSVGVNYAF